MRGVWPGVVVAVQLERIVGRFDVFHFSDWMYPPQSEGLRTTTIHDLVPVRFPEWAATRTRRMHVAKYQESARCRVIFTNSRYTSSDVQQYLGQHCPPVRVAYPGIDPRFSPSGGSPIWADRMSWRSARSSLARTSLC